MTDTEHKGIYEYQKENNFFYTLLIVPDFAELVSLLWSWHVTG